MRGYLVLLVSATVLTAACGGDDGAQSAVDAPSASAVQPSAGQHPWRVVITRSDGRTQIAESVDRPVVCGAQEEPKVIFLCGTSWVEGQPLPIAWDFLPVLLEEGETYAIEGPETPAPESEQSPTPTSVPR
jgi:hypothetical protein